MKGMIDIIMYYFNLLNNISIFIYRRRPSVPKPKISETHFDDICNVLYDTIAFSLSRTSTISGTLIEENIINNCNLIAQKKDLIYRDSHSQIIPGNHGILYHLQFYGMHGPSDSDMLSKSAIGVNTKPVLTINNLIDDCNDVVRIFLLLISSYF